MKQNTYLESIEERCNLGIKPIRKTWKILTQKIGSLPGADSSKLYRLASTNKELKNLSPFEKDVCKSLFTSADKKTFYEVTTENLTNIATLAFQEKTSNPHLTIDQAIDQVSRFLEATLCSQLRNCALSEESLRHSAFIDLEGCISEGRPLKYFQESHLTAFILVHEVAPYKVEGFDYPCQLENVRIDKQL